MADLQALLDRAWEKIQIGDLFDAKAIAKQVYQMSPNSDAVQHVLGLLASREGQHEIALNLLQQSLNAGKSQRKLRDIAEALFSAGYPKEALLPLTDAVSAYGDSPDLAGLSSAIYLDMADWQQAEDSAKRAIKLAPSTLAWDLNLSFAALMQQRYLAGFQVATSRDANLEEGGRCPVLNFVQPSILWLKAEQGLGDTLYYLRYVKPLFDLGWRFHLIVDQKLIPILKRTGLFESVVQDTGNLPEEAFWLNVGDLALAAMQCGIEKIPEPLSLIPDEKLVQKYKNELAEIGPAPYVAVTWRGGPRGVKQKNGVRLLEKHVEATVLGDLLSTHSATVVNLQRHPTNQEIKDFEDAFGKKIADYSALNNNLDGMLALLSLVDEYITVSNTNLHLREGLNLPSQVFVNRPFQDWRWLTSQHTSPWYPASSIYRQDENGLWGCAANDLTAHLSNALNQSETLSSENSAVSPSLHKPSELVDQYNESIAEGWSLLSNNIPKAIQKAKSVLDMQPNHARALHLLGWAAVQDFKYELALTVLEQASEVAPNDGIVWRDYLRCLILADDVDKAVKIAESCLKNQQMRSKSAIHYALAGAYYKVGREKKALEQYDSCLSISPNNLDALGFAGMMRMKLASGHAWLGFKQYSARPEAQMPHNAEVWVCPLLTGDVDGINILITRDMGLGDELTYLRYLPYLTKAGANVTYWCGSKLLPLLERLDLGVNLIPDSQPRPALDGFDLAFIVNELPVAVEHFGAPEVADSLPLKPDPALVEKWRDWLALQGEGPYIGFNWRAGAANATKANSFAKLAKSVDAKLFAESLSQVNATWVSLQRNVTKTELKTFEQVLGSPVADAAGVSDDLDEMLALLSLLDENVGVSNTNMHLRAGLCLGSRVLVQYPGGDWRWGCNGKSSEWFTNSLVYRQSKGGDWQAALSDLCRDLVNEYGQHKAPAKSLPTKNEGLTTKQMNKRIIWVSAGEIVETDDGYQSPLSSAQERVINVAQLLEDKGWHSDFVHEGTAEVMGGWQGRLPQPGDVVVFSKVVTDHSITLLKDATDRGAYTVVDVFNDFSNSPKRATHQKQLMELSDAVVSTEMLKSKWQKAGVQISAYIENTTNVSGDASQNRAINLWANLLEKQPKSHVNVLPNHLETKRVLVGMMYAGENEYEQAKDALKKQTHKNHDLIEVKNLPNKEAHDTLYSEFMSRAGDFDYFLKLDADMVFAHDAVIAEMLESIEADKSAHLFAYVKDCPSGLMIPGIQMFKSDTQWLGSDEQLNVDYMPKLYGQSKHVLDQDWVLHMPLPSDEQLFRYGIHKALKAVQQNQPKKSQRKALTHINILAGIARNQLQNKQLNFSLLGATLVFTGEFNNNQYHSELTKALFSKLHSDDAFSKRVGRLSQSIWSNEIQIYYRWLDLFKQDAQAPTIQAIHRADANASKQLIWLTAGKLDTSEGYVNSKFASTRYRVLLPAANLGPLGYQSQVVNEAELSNFGWGELKIAAGNVLIVSKSLDAKVLPKIEAAKKAGCYVIADYCDNHFNRNDALGTHQNAILKLADVVTTCSQELKDFLEQKTNVPVFFITDSFESNKKTPVFVVGEPLRLCWFGSHTNIDTLIPLMSKLSVYSDERKIELNVVTSHPAGAKWAKEQTTNRLKVNYIEWSKNSAEAAISDAQIVVIPTLSQEQKQVKSPNRIVESIWAGKYVVAGELPAYEPFKPFAYIGTDLIGGIKQALENPADALAKIKSGQDYIAQNHTPKLIGEMWHDAIQSVIAVRQSSYNIYDNVGTEKLIHHDSLLANFAQKSEISYLLTTDNVDKDNATQLERYFNAYPIHYGLDEPKIAVYTAIFGGYDDAPSVGYVDDKIDYILFSDNPEFEAPAPWQVRYLPPIFDDPQIDARRVKVLSHLFLVDYDITLWIDGNLQLKALDYPLVNEIASRAPIALCRHQFRSCIYEEMSEILRREIDASTPILKQNQLYRSKQFPKKNGLHATSFLVRNHQDNATVRLNSRWWELISQYSKRDQLSFDYVRWECNLRVLPLPFNLRDNELYFWGANNARGHKSSVRRNDEHHHRAFNLQSIDRPVSHHYQAEYENWRNRYITHLFELNQLQCENDAQCSPNLTYFNYSNRAPYSLPDPRLGKLQDVLKQYVLDRHQLLVIGSASGHDVLMCLNVSSAKVVHLSDCSESTQEFFKDNYSRRYQFLDFSEVLSVFEDTFKFDGVIVSCDGHLDVVSNHFKQLNALSDILVIQPNLEKTELLPKAQDTQLLPDKVFTKSDYGVWLRARYGDLTWALAITAKYGYFYSDWLRQQKSSVFIDIGANLGVYSLIAAQNHMIKTIYSFEPHPETFEYLQDNISYNKADKCKAFQLAIANESKHEVIHVKSDHSGVATLRNVNAVDEFDTKVQIECIGAEQLSTIVTQSDESIAVKVDVEGLEFEVLEAVSKSDFWPNVESIYYEVDESYLDYQAVETLLHSNGFKLEAKNGSGSHYDLLYIRET